ncbi:MAG: hypothetical protein K2M94_05595 [Paramuribaculum sp.]|nr:hypothetical protein [Paramuribaculum sp.]
MKRLILIVPLLLICVCSFAQKQEKEHKYRQWHKEMCEAKREYIAKELGLTRQQYEPFFTQYEAMCGEIDKIGRETRQMAHRLSERDDVTDTEYEKCAEALFELRTKEGAVEQKYYSKFKEILTHKQLYLLKQSEFKWMRKLMKQRKNAVKPAN